MMNKKYPLTLSQYNIWLDQQLYPESSQYVIGGFLEITGKAELLLLKKAVNLLIEQSQALRMVISTDAHGRPLQTFPDFTGYEVPVYDYSEKGYEMALSWIKESLACGFQKNHPPMYKFALLKITENRTLLLLQYNHIAVDGWGAGLCSDRIIRNYNALLKKEDTGTPFPPYTAYIEEDGEYRKSERYVHDREFWINQVKSPPSSVLNSTLFNRKNTPLGPVGSRRFIVPQDHAFKTRQLWESLKVSSTAFYLTLLYCFLSRLTGVQELVVGTPLINRSKKSFKRTPGQFVETFPVFFSDSSLSFKDQAKEISGYLYRCCRHQRFPSSEILQLSGADRDNSLFDIICSYEKHHIFSESEEYSVKTVALPSHEQKQALIFRVADSEEGLSFYFDYREDLFASYGIERFIEQFRLFFCDFLLNPSAPVKEKEIIPPGELKTLFDFNNTAFPIPEEKTYTELFEQCVKLYPQRTALTFYDHSYTYDELNRAANRVAGYLIHHFNPSPDDLIGVLLPRSDKGIIAILGILKTGAAYLPLDPSYPDERISFMVEDANSLTLISSREERGAVDINTLLSWPEEDNPSLTGSSRNLAYVIYTSGSTGRPKGVMIEHRSLVNYSYWFREELELLKEDVVAQYASISFDASVSEIFPTLLTGACLDIVPGEIRTDMDKLSEYFSLKRISVTFLPTAVYSLFKEQKARGLRALYTGGEKLENYQPQGYSLFNIYGPTENTVVSTVYRVKENRLNIPIGKPVFNSSAWILNRDNQLVPIGISGELCLSGYSLARGYLNREELTEERFIPHPLIEGERLYKSGDVARWLPDGNLEFLGRLDEQVKIRGFRIEPGEIESVITDLKGIESAALVAHVDKTGSSLAVYYTQNLSLSVNEVKEFLKERLPEYMLPSYYCPMDSLPVTTNGKIDKGKLPVPGEMCCENKEILPPGNSFEERLLKIWKHILERDDISVRDNFFHLGGHSLKAALLLSGILETFEADITLKDIFNNPVLENQARFIKNSGYRALDTVEKAVEREFYPLSSSQKRFWTLSQIEGGNSSYNVPGAFLIKGELDRDRLQKAFTALIERHESLRTVFTEEEGEPVQKIVTFTENPIEVRDLTLLKEEEILSLIEKEFLLPFDLEKGPLIRLVLLEVPWQREILVFNIHHIICDGWSLHILFKELSELYNGTFCKNELPFQYVDFSESRRSRLMPEQGRYWAEKLKNPPLFNMPGEKRRPSVMTYNGLVLEKTFNKELSKGVETLSAERGVSLFMTLQALVKTLLYRYTEQEDIIVGTPSAGRHLRGTDNQIGLYLNTLALRDSVKGDESFSDLLKRVSQTSLMAFENQDYPFEMILEDLSLKRDTSRSPLFDIMVVLQNNREPVLSLDGAELSLMDIPFCISKFDMTFEFFDTEDELKLKLEFNRDIYSRSFMERSLEHLETLTESVLKNPDEKIAMLNILSPSEKSFLLRGNDKEDIPSLHIAEVFQRRVREYPSHPALVFEDKVLTYSELDKESSRLAGFLHRECEIQKDDLIAIMLPRSEKLIITLLAILKAGGAYLPVDPSYPEERIRYMLCDARPSGVIGEAELLKEYDIPCASYDLNEILATAKECSTPEIEYDPSSLAYVIYTSGSTGNPKGVLLEHRGVFNLVESGRDLYTMDNNERVLQFSSLCFDASVEQIWLALLTGNTLVMISGETLMSHEEFNRYIGEKRVTHIDTVPSYLENINLQTPSLKRVVLGGEVFPGDLNPEEYNPDFFNTYGPTETTVTSVFCKVRRLKDGRSSHPIGKPLFNTHIYILDKNERLAPRGIPGELCIGGRGVARGYLNRPELTREKFLPDPFKESSFIYKTGDKVRWNEEGELEFLGRLDNQVKIRGQRVETGEIEHVLNQHPGIVRALVALNKKDRELTAWYIPENGMELSPGDYLREKLPEYMIPAYFVSLSSFPLLPNGKTDTASLPDPTPRITQTHVSPDTYEERVLQEVWSEIFSCTPPGVTESFFEMGGHSITAIRTASAAGKRGVNISVQDIFQYKTIRNILRQKKEKESVSVMAFPFTHAPFSRGIKEGETVLLTGATGFLGIHILRELLKISGIGVISHVRAATQEKAEMRLRDKLRFYFPGEQALYTGPLEVLSGDLCEMHLGLTSEHYKRLTERVGCVINAAALVKHAGDPEEFYKANVKVPENLIRFALKGDIFLTHISTMSLLESLPPGEGEQVFCEQHLPLGESDNIYLKTKAEGEFLIIKGRDKGLKAVVLRVGNLTGREEDGFFQENILENQFYGILKSIMNLGAVPEVSVDSDIEFSPVDRTAEAVIAILLGQCIGETYHLNNPCKISYRYLMDMICEFFMLKRVSDQEFSLLMEKGADRGDIFLQKLLLENGSFQPVSSEFSQKALKAQGFSWKKPCRLYFEKLFKHMCEREFVVLNV